MMLPLLIALLSSRVFASDDLSAALTDDDHCSDDDNSCALNALQTQGAKIETSIQDAEEEEVVYGSGSEGNCVSQGNYWYPNDKDSGRSEDVSVAGCKARCAGIAGCAHFSYWPDHGCQLQTASSYMRWASSHYSGVISGAPHCVPAPANLKIVYHQTGIDICPLIESGGFKIGHGGWCGKGIYFAETPEATSTKAITSGSHSGCMLKVTVDMGRMKEYPPCSGVGQGKSCHQSCKPISYHEKASQTLKVLESQGYNSVRFNPGDGNEFIVYEPMRVKHIEVMPWNEAWRPKRGGGAR